MRMSIVNYAIALKQDSASESIEEILDTLDWTDTALDFKLARAVLLEDFEEGAKIMMQIGKEGEIIREEAYHMWPLFREFIGSEVFRRTYEEIYGYPFITELQKIAKSSEEEIELVEDEFESIENEASV